MKNISRVAFFNAKLKYSGRVRLFSIFFFSFVVPFYFFIWHIRKISLVVEQTQILCIVWQIFCQCELVNVISPDSNTQSQTLTLLRMRF